MAQKLFALLFILSLGLAAGPVLAAGGGGGGGGSVSSSSSSSGPRTDPTVAYREGVALIEAGEYKQAEKKLRSVLRSVSKHARANFYLGVAEYGQQEYKSASKYFKKAIKYNSRIYQAYEQLGLAYLALDKPEDAQEQLDHLANFLETCGDTCTRAPIEAAYSSLKEAVDGKTSAEADQETSFLFEPVSDPRSAYLSAVELINAGRFAAAIVELEALSGSLGPHPDVFNYLGFAHRKLGRFDEALVYYEQALSINPNHLGANEYLGELYVEIGEIGKAKQRLAVLSRACPFGCIEYEDLRERIESRVVAGR